MSSGQNPPQASLDEILASIREIISEGGRGSSTARARQQDLSAASEQQQGATAAPEQEASEKDKKLASTSAERAQPDNAEKPSSSNAGGHDYWSARDRTNRAAPVQPRGNSEPPPATARGARQIEQDFLARTLADRGSFGQPQGEEQTADEAPPTRDAQSADTPPAEATKPRQRADEVFDLSAAFMVPPSSLESQEASVQAPARQDAPADTADDLGSMAEDEQGEAAAAAAEDSAAQQAEEAATASAPQPAGAEEQADMEAPPSGSWSEGFQTAVPESGPGAWLSRLIPRRADTSASGRQATGQTGAEHALPQSEEQLGAGAPPPGPMPQDDMEMRSDTGEATSAREEANEEPVAEAVPGASPGPASEVQAGAAHPAASPSPTGSETEMSFGAPPPWSMPEGLGASGGFGAPGSTAPDEPAAASPSAKEDAEEGDQPVSSQGAQSSPMAEHEPPASAVQENRSEDATDVSLPVEQPAGRATPESEAETDELAEPAEAHQAEPAAAEPAPAAPPAAAPASASPQLPAIVQHAAPENAPEPAAVPAVTATAASAGCKTLEDTVKDLLRPMLAHWVEENMPRLFEQAVREEIARKAAGKGGQEDDA